MSPNLIGKNRRHHNSKASRGQILNSKASRGHKASRGQILYYVIHDLASGSVRLYFSLQTLLKAIRSHIKVVIHLQTEPEL